jgi:hypothetical protein
MADITLHLTEEEAAIIETVLNEELIDLEDALYLADEYRDYEEYDALEVEYEFLNEIITDMQLQLVSNEIDQEVFA